MTEMARAQISALKDQWKANRRDRDEAKQLHRMAMGEWADDIPRMPSEPEHHAEKRPKFAPNLLGQALRALNTLYSEEPHRAIEDEPTQEWAGRALWGFGLGLSVAMERADVLTNLLGTSLLCPAYKTGPDAARDLRRALQGDLSPVDASGDGIEVLCLPRYQFEALANELDSRHAEAVIIHMGNNGEGKPIHHYWDRECFAVLHDFVPQKIGDGGDGDDEVIMHGLDDHPCVVCRNDEAALSMYSEGWGGADLSKNLLAIGSLFREYGWTAKLQRGQPYVMGENKNLVIAPDAVWEIQINGQAGILANNANLEGMLRAAMTHLHVWAQSVGLPARTFAVHEQRAGMSGVAIALDRAEITDHRNRRQKHTRLWERAITRKAAMLYVGVRGGALDASRLDVTYRPLPTIVTFSEKKERLEFLAGMGWLAPEDALREFYPDISDAEIEARLERAEEYHARRREEAQEDAERDAQRQTTIVQAQRPPDPLSALLT